MDSQLLMEKGQRGFITPLQATSIHLKQNLKSRENPESVSTAVGLQLSSSATTDLDHCPHLPEEDENISEVR